MLFLHISRIKQKAEKPFHMTSFTRILHCDILKIAVVLEPGLCLFIIINFREILIILNYVLFQPCGRFIALQVICI